VLRTPAKEGQSGVTSQSNVIQGTNVATAKPVEKKQENLTLTPEEFNKAIEAVIKRPTPDYKLEFVSVEASEVQAKRKSTVPSDWVGLFEDFQTGKLSVLRRVLRKQERDITVYHGTDVPTYVHAARAKVG
jgi:hypothetical protein